MYTHCLEENAKNGLPTDICDVQFKERECLYVDGAAWVAAGWGGFGHFVQLVLNTALSNLDIWVASAGYYVGCAAYIDVAAPLPQAFFLKFPGIKEAVMPGGPVPVMWYLTGCHTAGTLLTLTETNWFTSSFAWDFQANLEGTDYCVGYE